MSLEELLNIEAETDAEIKETEAEIEKEKERQKVLQRIKVKIELVRQKREELEALRREISGEKEHDDSRE